VLNDTVKSELNRLSDNLIFILVGVLGPLHSHCALGEGDMLHLSDEVRVRVGYQPKLSERTNSFDLLCRSKLHFGRCHSVALAGMTLKFKRHRAS
jgi:hypothetical protein